MITPVQNTNSSHRLCSLHKLPIDTIGDISSFLLPSDRFPLVTTSKHLSLGTIFVTNMEKRSELIAFIHKVLLTLAKDPSTASQQTSLSKILSSLNVKNTNSLVLMNVVSVKNEIINILNALNENQFSSIETSDSVQGLCKNIFVVCKICRKIPLAISNPSELGQWLDLKSILRDFVKVRELARALEVVNNISIERDKGDMLHLISEALIAEGNISKALEVANNIIGESKRHSALWGIAIAFVKAGNNQRAREIANSISNKGYREDLLRQIERLIHPPAEEFPLFYSTDYGRSVIWL